LPTLHFPDQYNACNWPWWRRVVNTVGTNTSVAPSAVQSWCTVGRVHLLPCKAGARWASAPSAVQSRCTVGASAPSAVQSRCTVGANAPMLTRLLIELAFPTNLSHVVPTRSEQHPTAVPESRIAPEGRRHKLRRPPPRASSSAAPRTTRARLSRSTDSTHVHGKHI
jgi:hypothetical protein